MITRRDLAAAVGGTVRELDRIAAQVGRGERYEMSTIKAGRSTRQIYQPDDTYDSIVKNLGGFFREVTSYQAPEWVFGFVRRRSTVQNAARHLAQEAVLTMDLLHFFPTITTAQVVAALTDDGFDRAAARLCGGLCTIDGRLPIGLSTSPHLSNLVFVPTDRALAGLAHEHGINFTRYVDDLTFSGSLSGGLVAEVTTLLETNGWRVNPAKTRLVRRGGAQYVTGLYVGSAAGPFIPRRLKRRMRWAVHMVNELGYDEYAARFGDESYGKLVGWARYICAVEPDRGKAMLQVLSANPPSEIAESGDSEEAWLDDIR